MEPGRESGYQSARIGIIREHLIPLVSGVRISFSTQNFLRFLHYMQEATLTAMPPWTGEGRKYVIALRCDAILFIAMVTAGMRFVNCCAEFLAKDEIEKMPKGIRGIYALLKQRPRLHEKYDVVYIGMARRGAGGVRSRLLKHRRSKKKGQLWTHFSVYSVWSRIPDAEVVELEGLFRHIYRRDTRANNIARQKTFDLLRATRENDFEKWRAS